MHLKQNLIDMLDDDDSILSENAQNTLDKSNEKKEKLKIDLAES